MSTGNRVYRQYALRPSMYELPGTLPLALFEHFRAEFSKTPRRWVPDKLQIEDDVISILLEWHDKKKYSLKGS